MWKYNTNIGPIYIKEINNKYYFIFREEHYICGSSPESVADDVYSFVTGCDEWDDYEDETDYTDIPTDLSQWIDM